MTRSPWFPLGSPSRTAALRLFCFAHAGGSANSFRQWQALLPPEIAVCPVQLPGHSTRLREPAISRMGPLVEAVTEGLSPWLDLPFAIFGHSMGAAVGHELAHRLRAAHGIEPAYFFASGRRAPTRPMASPIHQLPPERFVQELRRLNGTPTEALDNPELLELIVPMLRADFEVIETCTYTPRPPLRCPIVALGGIEDHEVTREDLAAWAEMSTAAFSLYLLPGDHFFVNTARSEVTRIVAECHVQHTIRTARPDARDPVSADVF
jgi:medium-chain acyl-[acyl-carrier-protein] hydrolase